MRREKVVGFGCVELVGWLVGRFFFFLSSAVKTSFALKPAI